MRKRIAPVVLSALALGLAGCADEASVSLPAAWVGAAVWLRRAVPILARWS
jgi:hypothetical protein